MLSSSREISTILLQIQNSYFRLLWNGHQQKVEDGGLAPVLQTIKEYFMQMILHLLRKDNLNIDHDMPNEYIFHQVTDKAFQYMT